MDLQYFNKATCESYFISLEAKKVPGAKKKTLLFEIVYWKSSIDEPQTMYKTLGDLVPWVKEIEDKGFQLK